MDLKTFKYELEKRGIPEKGVPHYLLKEGRMKIPIDDAYPIAVESLKHVTRGALLGAAGGLALQDLLKLKGDENTYSVGGLVVGSYLGGKRYRDKFNKNGRMRGMYRDKYLQELDAVNAQSDMTHTGDVKMPSYSPGERWIPEEDKEQETRKVSKRFSGYNQQVGSWGERAKALATSTFGKVVIAGGTMYTLYKLLSPLVLKKLKSMNTQSIDTSGYRYSDDAAQVSKCASRFSDFLTQKDVVQATVKFRYEDMEKVYLDTMEAIERSSPEPYADKKYLETMWQAIFSIYQSQDAIGRLDQQMRVNPNSKSMFTR